MVVELISAVPPWILVGIALGGVASALAALVFYLGNRFVAPSVAAAGDDRTAAGDERRRREIREYLTAVDERFREDHAFGEVAVPFYLPEREVAITFDAHDYFRLEGEGVYTVLCEHEMPGRGLGRRLPFDVIEPDWGPDLSAEGGGRDPVAAAFAELDVDRDADADEVKRAYRERVKETHPDQGGDEESFRRVREAYATARNHAGGAGEESGRNRPAARTDGTDPRTDRTDPPTGFGR
ncbi:J domain-containing protein [Halorubrum sp. SD626R]|uniref:J domain-containing protein n=1 Tax=Halorubrum sp. SD626R TaxID=1419722 RepID=UPI000AADAABB|nr:J domain-containing protein [Halorubrum sp. SD626R]TKX79583.1 J domain-containing protein [Halorubrum sp. SD626R]